MLQGRRRLLPIGPVVAAMLLAMAAVGSARAQQADAVDLSDLQGTLIAQGTNTQPVGFLNLKTYRLEELTLPAAIRVTVRGQTVTTSKGWRVVINGGPFVVRDMPATIWIDDSAAGIGQESVDLSELSTVVFDSSLLREGAVLAVSYQSDLDRTELPERLGLGGASL